MFSDMWVDLIRQAHAEISEEEAVLYARADGALAAASYLAIDLVAPDFRVRRLVVAGTTADGAPCRDAYTHGIDDFPPELAALVEQLADAQRECPWEL